MKRHILLLLMSTIYILGFGQNGMITTLQKEITNSKTDIDKIIPMSKLAILYCSTEINTASDLARKATKLSEKQKDKKYALYAYAALCNVHAYKDSIRVCYNTIDTCMHYLDKTEDIDSKAFAINQIASIKIGFEDRDDVLNLLDKAYQLLKDHKNDELETKVYYNMFRFYSYTDIENTAKYARLSLSSAIKNSNPQLIVQSWNAMGFYYQNLFEKMKREPIYLDSAIYVLRQSINVAERNKDYVTDTDRAMTYINISSTFSHKNRIKENVISSEFADSITYYVKNALTLSKEINNPQIQAYAYGILAEVDFSFNRLNDAEALLLKGISVIDSTDISKAKYTLHTNIAGLYEMKKEYSKAFDHLVIAQQNFIKINTEKYTKEGQLLAAKYEFEKKEREIQFQQKQNTLYLGIAIFLSLGLIFLILFFTYRIKYLKQKEKSLELEKYEAILMAELKETETKRLQQEAVISNLQLNYKNELLDNILKNSSIDKDKIEKILSKELKIDNNFEDFRTELKEIHPDFYIKLQNKTKQKLTPLDFKYCVCIFMKMSSKEIAELFHVENATVRITKYRLKQKLNLSKEDDLNTFIEEII